MFCLLIQNSDTYNSTIPCSHRNNLFFSLSPTSVISGDASHKIGAKRTATVERVAV